jgi:hypothetical protein
MAVGATVGAAAVASTTVGKTETAVGDVGDVGRLTTRAVVAVAMGVTAGGVLAGVRPRRR